MRLLVPIIGVLIPAVSARADDVEFFEKQIRPLLVERCHECHGDEKQEGGLRLTGRELLLKGGDTGPAAVAGKPDESLLIRAVEYLDEPKMPPSKKLADAEIAALKKWIAAGATWPASTSPSAEAAGEREFEVTRKQREWWAFQPVNDAAPPAVTNQRWTRNPIDEFIVAELEARGLSPAPDADRRTWLRRATFDVTGLPPSPAEIAAFLEDDSDQAHETVVERLLASPAYGERWARHWLDIARYADFHDGNPKARTASCEPLNAWRYRDWVVKSLNRDLPFDEFIVHQIAGDLLPSPDGREFYEDGLVATTFLTNGVWDRGDADKEKIISDMADDNIDTVGKAFMGLTFGCARCHDHKFDPFSQADYYAIAGIFYSTHVLKELGAKGGEYTLNRVPLIEKAYVDKRDEQLRRLAELNAKLAELDKKDPKPAADDPERTALVTDRDSVQKELLPEPPVAEAVAEGGMPGGLFPGIQDVPIHIRGSYTRLGPVVPRRMPDFLAGDRQPTIAAGSGRPELARWVASTQNPLTARVIANRIWQWHFGTGLVRTPNNFGLMSEPPSHPALLDWLASRLMEDGWSLKKLHRRILLSATYRQSSWALRAQVELDPENLWLGRFMPRRLEAEAIRDAMLAVSGRLDSTPGGPASDDLSIARRSIYVQTARWDRSSFAMLFDAANPDASDEKRSISTVAPQALFLLNGPFVLAQAKDFADRLDREAPIATIDASTSRIRLAYELLYGRPPRSDEIAIAMQLVGPSAGNEGWADLAHVLLCSNEFVYLD
jgi:cytochrome c553